MGETAFLGFSSDKLMVSVAFTHSTVLGFQLCSMTKSQERMIRIIVISTRLVQMTDSEI